MSKFKIVAQSQGIKELQGDFDKLTKSEQKFLQQTLLADKGIKKVTNNRKGVSQLEQGFNKLKTSIIGLAGPGAAIATFISAVRKDIEHTLKMIEKAKSQNTTYAQSVSDLFTNDRMFKDNKKLQNDFDNFFKEQGKKSVGVIDQLPAAVAGARSKTAALEITKDPKFIKLAAEAAVNNFTATLGKSDMESDITGIAQIAERDKRKVSLQEKVNSAEAQKAEFQSLSATDATSASAIIPRALSSLNNFGTKEQILGLQAFATNQGLTQDTALSGIMQIDQKLSKHKKFKNFEGSGFERLLKAREMIDSGKIKESEFSGTERTILNSVRSNPEQLQSFITSLGGAQNTKGSTSLANLEAQMKLNPALRKIVKARAAQGSSEVKALQATKDSDTGSALEIGKSNLESSGASGSQVAFTDTIVENAAGAKLIDDEDIQSAYEYARLVRLADKKFLGSNILYQANPFINDNNAQGREQLRKEIIEGVTSGRLVNAEDGLDKTEQERLRVAGVTEEQLTKLNQLQEEDNKEMLRFFSQMLIELQKLNSSTEKTPKPTLGEF